MIIALLFNLESSGAAGRPYQKNKKYYILITGFMAHGIKHMERKN